MRTRALEIDPRVVAVARAQFSLPPDDERLSVEVGDGAEALACAEGEADLLVVDAFEDETPAAPTATAEFFERAHRALAPGGVMAANLMSDDPALVRRVRTIGAAFGGALLQMGAISDENLIVFGFRTPPARLEWDELRSRAQRLEARLGLPFPRYVGRLRAKNRWTRQHLELVPGDGED